MVKEIVDKHDDLFKGSLGKLKGPLVTLHLNEQVLPKFFKSRIVPLALKKKKNELDQLQSLDIIEPVKYSSK